MFRLTHIPGRLLWLLALLALGAALGSGAQADASYRAESIDLVPSLTVVPRPTPRLNVPRYRTMGTYPQVVRQGLDLRLVNKAFRATVVAEQNRYAPIALKQEARSPDPIRLGYRGLFATATVTRLLSANTTVASALIPVDEIFPGGHESGYWLSVTMRVPSGSRVALPDLLANRNRGLAALAAAATKAVLSHNRCVRDSVRQTPTYERGFRATVTNYRHFALTKRGLAVGFSIYQIALGISNRTDTTVPYSVLRPYLSPLGMRLISAVEQSR
jgi:hypothetical protein